MTTKRLTEKAAVGTQTTSSTVSDGSLCGLLLCPSTEREIENFFSVDSEFDVFLGFLFSMGIGFQAKVGEFENWDIQDLEMEKDFCFWVGTVWLCSWWIWLGNLKVGVSESDCELWGMIIEYHFYCEYLCCTIIGFFHFFSLQFFINFSIVYNYYF